MKSLLIAAMSILLAPLAAFSQPLIDRIPSDAVIYVGWQGSKHMPAAYADSHLKAVLDASNFDALFADFLPQVVRKMSNNDPNAEQGLKLLAAIGGPLMRHPSALYIGGVDFSDRARPRPHAAILCQAGEEADALLKQIQQVLDMAPKAPFPVKAFKSGEIVVFSVGFDAETQAIAGAAADSPKSLATNAAFRQSLARVQADAVLMLYVDVERAVAQIDQGFATLAKGGLDDAWMKARDAFGLGGIRRVIVSDGFDGRDWMTKAFVDAPAPRKGIAAILDSEPVSPDALKLIPDSAMAAGVERLDLAWLFENVRSIVGVFDQRAQREFDAGIAKAGEFLGFDLRRDFIDAFSNEWTYYCADLVNGLPTMVMINRLKKPAEAERAAERLVELGKQQLAQAGARAGVRLTERKLGQITVRGVSVQMIEICWAFANGNFYFANSSQAIEKAMSAPARNITENRDFVALQQRLGVTKYISFNYNDLSKTVPVIYPGLMLLVEMGFNAARQAGFQPPEKVFPTLQQLLAHVGPAAGFSWTDDAGWHYRSVCPFPLSTTLSPNGGSTTYIASAAVAASIMLPALNAAKERANRIKCASNLRQIGQASMLYAQKDQKTYPATVGPLITDCELSWECFLCPSSGTKRPQFGNARIEDVAKWAEEHCDYIHLGATVKAIDPADRILAYDKPGNHERDGINILFNDGHVEWMPMDRAMRMVRTQALTRPSRPR